MLIVPIAFFAVITLSLYVVIATLVVNRDAILRALQMDAAQEWRSAPSPRCAPQVRRVVRQRTLAVETWRVAA